MIDLAKVADLVSHGTAWRESDRQMTVVATSVLVMSCYQTCSLFRIQWNHL